MEEWWEGSERDGRLGGGEERDGRIGGGKSERNGRI